MNQPANHMRKPLEVWQAVIATILLVITVSSIIVNQSNRITRDEAQIGILIENKGTTEAQFEKVNASLERINSKLTDILVELEDKQNRAK
jgi:hypothetical protein